MFFLLLVQVELLGEHVMQLALSHDDASVRNRASQCLESTALYYPHVTKDTILPALLQLLTLSMCSCARLCPQISKLIFFNSSSNGDRPGFTPISEPRIKQCV